jgi:hypothetical protein
LLRGETRDGIGVVESKLTAFEAEKRLKGKKKAVVDSASHSQQTTFKNLE